MSMTKEKFNIYCQLAKKVSWLNNPEKSAAIYELFDICGDGKNEMALLVSLLERFYYPVSDECSALYSKIADYLTIDQSHNPETLQIIPISNANEIKSGLRVIRGFSLFYKMERFRNENCFVESLSSSKNMYKKGKSDIVLLDDFIGTGKSFIDAINKIKKYLKGYSDYSIFCCALTGMKQGITKIEDDGYNVFCAKVLNKGLSDYYTDDKLVDAKKLMLSFEEKLAKQVIDNKSKTYKQLSDYSFGFKESEALVSFQGVGENTPNNVFPIFWWKQDCEERDRNVLCYRSGI